MTESLHVLIEALREELQQYGELLALLDLEQTRVLERATEDLLQTVAAVYSQGAVVQAARQQREARRRAVARSLGLGEEAGFTDLIPHLPEDYQPLVKALVQENNELLARVQRRARQNHLLLSRSLELMQRFIGTLSPAAPSTTYDGHGTAVPAVIPLRPLYEAVV
jgi:flagellar biosynthesis/type III secretory pathway chaperone